MPHRLLLVGLGHAHMELLQCLRRDDRRRPAWHVTVLTASPPASNPHLIYTGMITAVLAGEQSLTAAQLPARQIAEQAGATIVTGHLQHIDPQANLVHHNAGPPLPFDFLSLAIGSATRRLPAATPANLSPAPASIPQVPLRPIDSLVDRLQQAFTNRTQQLLQQTAARSAGSETAPNATESTRLRVTVIGVGWAGLETACCLAAPQSPWRSQLRGPVTLLCEDGAALRFAAARRALATRPVEVLKGRALAIDENGLQLTDHTHHATDIAILATGPIPQPDVQWNHLPLLADGFLRTRGTLQVEGYPHLLALGDAAGGWYPRNGVQAIRQGRLAWQNLNRLANRRNAKTFRAGWPRLQLVNLGDQQALVHWGPVCFATRWGLHLKRAIDQRYVNAQGER